MIGMETSRQFKDIGTCRSKASRKWVCRKGCYASIPRGIPLPSASCRSETSHVGDRSTVDIQN